mgnify:CR=1 FL=1
MPLLHGLLLAAAVGAPVDRPVIRAELGYSHLFAIGDPDLDPVAMHGLGVDLFGGWELGSLDLVPEIQVGFHLFPSHRREHGFDVDTVWTVIPILAGARYHLRAASLPLSAHASAHLGVVHQYWHRELLGIRGSGSGTNFGLNVGLGGDWMISEVLGVGVSIRYWFAASQNDEVEDSGNTHLLTAAACASLAL